MNLSRNARVLSVPLFLVSLVAAGAVTANAAAPASDRTSAVEAQRVDRVPVPRFDWWGCSVFSPGAQCASVNLPLDYDQPKGAQTTVAVLRIKATDQEHKIGTLFLNPGGPGGSSIELASAAPNFLGPDLLAKFDIVGFDPRGTNYSENVQCWKNIGEQAEALSGANVEFPWTDAEKASYITSSKAFGKACSTTGTPLSGSMSTAEVARDMDVLRRSLGDEQLTYLGFSYGTYLGQVYANLFPDRVRALAIDGVVDPVAWAGTETNNVIPMTTRLRSGEGATKALHEVLVRCAKAGPGSCSFASSGNPVANYAAITSTLRKGPIPFKNPTKGATQLSYASMVVELYEMLYKPDGAARIPDFLTSVYTLIKPRPASGTPAAAQRAQAAKTLSGILDTRKSRNAAEKAAKATQAKRSGFAKGGFPYENGWEAYQSVMCTDGLNPADASMWPTYADASDKTAPDFGRLWTWASTPCAAKTWTVQDEDRYAGPFTRRTANPVLVVGNYWDPATNYDSAVAAASRLPNSQLLSNDSWGHTAYGSSECATTAVDSYLVSQALPTKGTACTGDVQPFATSVSALTVQAASGNRRAPVVPLIPGAPRR
jgi:pimeloyl-ACP methyl ester carboxylesterase